MDENKIININETKIIEEEKYEKIIQQNKKKIIMKNLKRKLKVQIHLDLILILEVYLKQEKKNLK